MDRICSDCQHYQPDGDTWGYCRAWRIVPLPWWLKPDIFPNANSMVGAEDTRADSCDTFKPKEDDATGLFS